MLQNSSIDEPFESFCTANILEVVNDSDRRECLEKFNAIYRRENDFDQETDSKCSRSELENR